MLSPTFLQVKLWGYTRCAVSSTNVTEWSGARWANTALIMFAEKCYASSTIIL